MSIRENYINSAIKQFLYYKQLGEKTFLQLEDEDLFATPGEESNSIAVIVNHLSGNMRSRWTDLFDADGEKPWRNRDAEFESTISSREELLETWHAGWRTLLRALNSIDERNFNQLVYIRNIGHSVIEAINRQLCHYAYHIGQIVYIGKLRRGKMWTSLSIPKGQSTNFNESRFAVGKHRGHFTDDLLEPDDDATA